MQETGGKTLVLNLGEIQLRGTMSPMPTSLGDVGMPHVALCLRVFVRENESHVFYKLVAALSRWELCALCASVVKIILY